MPAARSRRSHPRCEEGRHERAGERSARVRLREDRRQRRPSQEGTGQGRAAKKAPAKKTAKKLRDGRREEDGAAEGSQGTDQEDRGQEAPRRRRPKGSAGKATKATPVQKRVKAPRRRRPLGERRIRRQGRREEDPGGQEGTRKKATDRKTPRFLKVRTSCPRARCRTGSIAARLVVRDRGIVWDRVDRFQCPGGIPVDGARLMRRMSTTRSCPIISSVAGGALADLQFAQALSAVLIRYSSPWS